MDATFPLSDIPAVDAEALFHALSGATPPQLVCASSRQAQALHAAYARWQQQAGCAVWETPQIVGFEVFIQWLDESRRAQAALQGAALPVRLSDAESRLLWRLAISDSDGAPLLREAEAAQLAAEAWRLAHEYRLPLPFDAQGHADIESFNGWARRYRERLQRLDAVDTTQNEQALLDALQTAQLEAPAHCVFCGFVDATPRLSDWMQTLRARGTRVERLAETRAQDPAQPQLHIAADDEQELRAAARWARQCSQARPQARIGVIVADLGARRAAVQRIFDEQLCPELDAVDAHALPRPYNLTLGVPLAQLEIVQTALRLLQWLAGGLDAAAATALLNSPYWGADEAMCLRRAALDAELRRAGVQRVDIAACTGLAAPALRAALQPLAAFALRRRQTPDEWNETLTQFLDAAQWPGPRALDSEEFQALARWRELLGEFARLARVLGRVPLSAAVAQLRDLAADAVFQPQSPETPIQIMGLLEAQGLRFDALWVVGLDDERFPAPSRPQPFIPHALQRRHGLPHATAARELAYAQAQLAGWRGASTELHLSFALGSEERSRAASPLLAAWFGEARRLDGEAWPQHWQRSFDSRVVEMLDDAQAPSPDPQAVLPGGTRVLGEQARCPFRGFAITRLGLRPLPATAYGLQGYDRGNLVHRVLERLWRHWQEQAVLRELSVDARAAQLHEAVEAELQRLQAEAPYRLPAQFRELESARLRELVGIWLEVELQRPPFRVLAIEQHGHGDGATRVTEFEGLRFKLRPDRIDAGDDGQRVVLDYKTGARQPPPWAGGRPEDPQLLLYALIEPEIAALAFARVAVGDIGLQGLGRDDSFGAGIKPYASDRNTSDADSWTALLGRWRGELATLASEVRRGWAAVLPKQPRVSCRDCGLHAVCRIRDEVSLDEGDEVAA